MLADGLPLVESDAPESVPVPLTAEEEDHLEKLIAELQAAMWSYAGLLRGNFPLLEGFASQQEFTDGLKKLLDHGKASRRLAEAQAMSRVANAILHSALARTESRGAHFRNDFPKRDDENFSKHSALRSDGKVTFEEW
jgi:succinate dehydrogenase/fumarate reductase flavoprotein subunit